MTMRRTPEWYEAHQAKRARDCAIADLPTAILHDKDVYHLVTLFAAGGLPTPVPEYLFHPTRKWRFDYAWPLHKIAVEIDGGVWTQGRHTRGAGFIADAEKMNAAAKLGWRVLRYTPGNVGESLDDVGEMLART